MVIPTVERQIRIAIVGGGVAGAAAAAFLSRLSEFCVVTLFERRLGPDMKDGGALLLKGEGLKVYKKLLHRADKNNSAPAVRIPSGDELYIMRDDLMKSLLDPIQDRICCKYNCEILGVRERSTEVELDYRQLLVQDKHQGWVRNNSSATSTETFDLVIGADGNAPSSRILRHVVSDADAQAQEVPMLVINALVQATASDMNAGNHEVDLHDDSGVVQGKLSVQAVSGLTSGSEDWVSCTVMTFLPDPMQHFPRPETWASTMKEKVMMCKDTAVMKRAMSIIEEAASPLRSDGSRCRLRAWVPFHRDSVKRWSSELGRCVLLGDTAHLMPPTPGWGASCGMGDGQELAQQLARLLGGPDPLRSDCWISALKSYEETRRKIADDCVSESREEAFRIVGRYP